MFDGFGSSTGSGGGGSDSGDLIAWVNDNFVSKNFFNQLFTIHGHDEDDTSTPPEDVIVTPNDTQTIIDSIEAMFDFYSEKAISALGLNSQGGGGGASTLADLNDVDLTTPTNGQVLMYNSTTGKWYNGTVQGGGGGTVTSIVAGTGLSGGTITTSGTIAISSETQTDIGKGVTAYGWGNHADAGYLTSSDISDMATQTWVGQNYLGLHSTADKATKLATARTLWGQSFDGTANVTGSLTDVINITGSGTLHRFTSMELNSQGDLSGYGGYIDYHYNGGGTDYTSRLVEESVGVLSLKAKTAADVSTLAGLIVGAAVDGSFVQVGSVRLVYDSTNNAIKVVGSDGTTAANFYATGAVSALGANSQSGGGGLTMDDVWDALGSGSGPDGGRQINASHVSYALFGYATQTWVNNQSFAKGVKVGSTTYSTDSNGIVDLGTISGTDTKDTAGNQDLYSQTTSPMMYLVGVTSKGSAAGSYTTSFVNQKCYIGTDNCLYSNGTKVLTSEQYHGTVTSVVIGSGGTPISPVNGVVTLPAYPDVSSFMTSSDLWQLLAATAPNDSSQQVHVSHLVQALTGYATQSWVTSQGYITGYTDTKNTAGTTDKPNTKLFLVGAESQGANPQTYSNSSCYINTNNKLVSGGSVVATTTDLGSYLPLTGGTITGVMDIESSSATRWLSLIKTQTSLTAMAHPSGYGMAVSSTKNDTTYLLNCVGNQSTIGIGGDSRLIVLSNGNVGIGTTTPTSKFEVVGGGRFTNSIYMGGNTSAGIHIVSSGIALHGTNQSWSGTIMDVSVSTGNIGLGANANTSYKLNVGGAGYFTGKVYSEGNEVLTSGNVVTTDTTQTITGAKTFTGNLTVGSAAAFSVAARTTLSSGAKMKSLCIECASDGAPANRDGEINRYTTSGDGNIHLQYDSGTGGVTMCQNKLKFSYVSGSGCYIASNNNNMFLDVGTASGAYCKLFQSTSDIRKKDVVTLLDRRIEEIANAPVFDFMWKGENTGNIYLGTSAQYWQTVFQHGVSQAPDGYLAMDYGATALAAAVITARKVVNHEERIAALERENEELRKELELLKAA